MLREIPARPSLADITAQIDARLASETGADRLREAIRRVDQQAAELSARHHEVRFRQPGVTFSRTGPGGRRPTISRF